MTSTSNTQRDINVFTARSYTAVLNRTAEIRNLILSETNRDGVLVELQASRNSINSQTRSS